MDNTYDSLKEVSLELEKLVEKLNAISNNYRNRFVSIAITKAEESQHRVVDAIREFETNIKLTRE